MNLSELNGSGKSLRVFFTTATIALLTTGALWFLVEEASKYNRWRTRYDVYKERFTIGSRIGMIVSLRRCGHTDWMRKHGFWWRILINSDSRLSSPIEYRGLRACDFVSKYGPSEDFLAFHKKTYVWRSASKFRIGKESSDS